MRNLETHNQALPEPLYTIRQAALLLNILPWKLDRAVRAGLIPHFTLITRRRLVRLSDVVALIESSRQGGVV